jgi:hypothetical protein
MIFYHKQLLNWKIFEIGTSHNDNKNKEEEPLQRNNFPVTRVQNIRDSLWLVLVFYVPFLGI